MDIMVNDKDQEITEFLNYQRQIHTGRKQIDHIKTF